MQRTSDLDTFHGLLGELETKIGGKRRLGACDGRMNWPERGVYFVFEPGENRHISYTSPRVVRVGTHALMARSRTTLWKRLCQHRGTLNPHGGNHRGSIFRLLAGEAMMIRDPALMIESWGRGSSAPRATRLAERQHESLVSDYLGAMMLVFLPVSDAPGPRSVRGVIERNAIALLSGYRTSSPDRPSPNWLGRFSGRDRVRRSGLWNNNHVDEEYDPTFLSLFEDLIRKIPSAYPKPSITTLRSATPG